MNSIETVLQFLTLLILFFLSSFFSGSETALFSLTPVQIQQMRKSRPKATKRIEALLANPSALLSTLLVGNTIVNFCIAWLGFRIALSVTTPRAAELITIPLITFLLLLFGEITPKRLALSHTERYALKAARPLQLACTLLRPITSLLKVSPRAQKTIFRPERRALSDDELLTVMEVGEEQGGLESEERDMVDGIIRLSELKASDVMTPRVDLICIDRESTPEEHHALITRSRYRHIPVYTQTPDTIVGFLHTDRYLLAHHLARQKDTQEPIAIADFIRPAVFVPENLPLDELLITLQRNSERIACVLDEYGGTAGVVTRGDILELVIEPVKDKASPEENADLTQLSATQWIVNGRASLEDLNYELDLKLEADDADRISGWVTYHCESLPRPGMFFEAQGVRCTIRRLRHRAVDQVLLEIVKQTENIDTSVGIKESLPEEQADAAIL